MQAEIWGLCWGTDMGWDDGGRKIKLDQGEWIDMGPRSRDSAVNAVAQKLGLLTVWWVGWLVVWLAETWIERRLTRNELEVNLFGFGGLER